MDLLALRYFQVVARLEHVSRAADELRVAQPSLSRTIARLEHEVGVPLFDRRGRQVRLNSFGTAFLRRTDRILAELDDARRELSDAAGLESGSVAVVAETLLTLTAVLSEFLSRHPQVQMRLYQSNAASMAEQLQNREVDFCVASQPIEGPDLARRQLLREEVLLAVPLEHPLAERESASVRDLDGLPFVTTRPGHWQRALCDRLFAEMGLVPNVVCEGDEPGATQHLISAGLGVGLIPTMSRQAGVTAPVAWLPVRDVDCSRTLTLVWREDAFLSGAAKQFARTCQSVFAEMARRPPAGEEFDLP